MSGKQARQVRKEFNKLEEKIVVRRSEVADDVARELLNSPFKYRFKFAMKIIFHRRKK